MQHCTYAKSVSARRRWCTTFSRQVPLRPLIITFITFITFIMIIASSHIHIHIVTDPPAVIFMGRDKYENEELITHGWDPEDVWFHVDKLSSAHVYLRMPKGMTWDAIPEALLQDLGQLTKANSIEGEL
jgi:hypothetical protein